MKSWKNPFSWFRPETKASASGVAVSAFGAGQPVWSERDYVSFAKEAYLRNAIAFRCIAMKAQAAASIPFLLNDGSDKEIDKHPMLDLLKRPAPGYTQSWLIESLITYMDLSGQSYLERVGPNRKNAPPRELWSLRPDRMKVIAGTNGIPQGFRYEVNGRQINWQVDPVTGDSDILHIRRFNPVNDWYGMSLVEPAAFAVDRHNEAGAHNMSVLQNSATPSGAMVFKPVIQDGQAVSAPKEVIEAAEKRLMERYSGATNAGKPMTLGGNVDWVSFGMTMEQLQLTESKLDAARDICITFGVPIELLLPGQSTFNNKREAKLEFYEETVLPEAKKIIDHLNIWLAPRFGDNLLLKPNLDEIEALSLRREIRQKNTLELYKGNVIGRDEARSALQFEPEPDMPQHKVDGPVLTSLVNAVLKDGSMFLPLFNYMRSVGLVDKKLTLEQFVSETAGLFDDDAEDVVAALTDQTDPGETSATQ